MKVPSIDVVEGCISDFIKATSTAAISSTACVSCARELFSNATVTLEVDRIPNPHLLKPNIQHVKQDIVNGMVIYKPAMKGDRVTICMECLHSLQDGKVPKYSLANNLWIGDVPIELSCLTLPERILIARYFPAAYIVKLYPKQRGATSWKDNQLYRGLKGNVATYRLDPQQVASVICDDIEGDAMPHPAKILSATIGITFIGPKGLSEKTMPSMFQVRRLRVREALIWLKRNNPLYADIEIHEERLRQLPYNGIPDELMCTARYSSDIESVHREHDGYVPLQNEEGNELMSCLVFHSNLKLKINFCNKNVETRTYA